MEPDLATRVESWSVEARRRSPVMLRANGGGGIRVTGQGRVGGTAAGGRARESPSPVEDGSLDASGDFPMQ